MLFPALFLTMFATLPAQSEQDMTPVLAPAIVIEEASSTGDLSPVVDLADVADIGSMSAEPSGRTFITGLEPAVVVKSAQ